MKKYFFLAIFILFIFSRAYSQNETTVQDIMDIANEKVQELEDMNQEVVNMTVDLVTTGKSKSIYRYLDPTFTYTVLAIGDRRINDIRITVNKAGRDSWEFISDKSGNEPSLTFMPSEAVEYQFSVSVDKWKGNNSAGHFALILYHINPEKKK